jgi:phytoene/squalene synthetase
VIRNASDRDLRDKSHLLLVERAALVDEVFLTFDLPTRGVIADLVRDMAEGMRWSSATFAAQGGVLDGEEQLATYCRHVLGNPALFMIRLIRLHNGEPTSVPSDYREQIMRVGEMTQLANVTRDVEKDLRRGISYDSALREHLGREVQGDAGAMERVREVRRRLLRVALLRVPDYKHVINGMRLPRLSLVRASAIIMLLFTEQYFRGPDTAAAIILRGILAAASRRRADREMARVENAFLECARVP